jgi:hypothetical protein
MDFYEEFLKLKTDQSFYVEMVNHMRNCKRIFYHNYSKLYIISDSHTIIGYNLGLYGKIHQNDIKYKEIYYIVPIDVILKSYQIKTPIMLYEHQKNSFMKKRKKIYKTENTKHFNTTILAAKNGVDNNKLEIYMDILNRNFKLKELLNNI